MPAWFPASLADLCAGPRARRARGHRARSSRRSAPRAARSSSRAPGSRARRTRQALVAFARAAQIPVVTTMGDPGRLPERRPALARHGRRRRPPVGARGTSRSRPISSSPSAPGSNAMTRQPVAQALARCRVAAVNVDAGEIRRALSPSVVVEADAGVDVPRAPWPAWHEAPFDRAPTVPATRSPATSPSSPTPRPRRAAPADQLLPERGPRHPRAEPP